MTDRALETDFSEDRITKAADFRYVPADMVRIAMNDQGVKIQFVAEDGPKELTALMQVHLTHHLARRIQEALASALDQYEQKEK